MSFTISVGTVNKRSNSTYVPSTELTTDYAVVLKDGCSDHNPVFLLNISSNTFPHNYLQWGNWYYYIDDVVREKNQLMSIHCHLDELATYKAYIQAGSAFVAYDTTANTELIDSRLSINTSMTINTSEAGNSLLNANRCVIVGIVGKDSSAMWAMSESTASTLLNSIKHLSEQEQEDVDLQTDTLDQLVGKMAYNVSNGIAQFVSTGRAPDCIKSAILLPVAQSAFNSYGSSETIYLGAFNTGITALKLNATAKAYESSTVTIPWQFTDWRRNAPYTDIYLKLPYVGTISLPPSQLMGINSLQVQTYVSTNGSISYIVNSGNNPIGRFGGNCGSNFMIGSSNINPFNSAVGAVAGLGGAIGGLVTGGATGVMASGTSAIAGAVNSIMRIPTNTGSSGGGAFTDYYGITCTVISHNTNVDPTSVTATIGTPTMAVKSLAGLTGYVETKNASIAVPAPKNVIDSINSQLDSGIYIE